MEEEKEEEKEEVRAAVEAKPQEVASVTPAQHDPVPESAQATPIKQDVPRLLSDKVEFELTIS